MSLMVLRIFILQETLKLLFSKLFTEDILTLPLNVLNKLLMVLLIFYIILGCFLDGISSVVLTMAVVEPMVRQAGIDLIWFGIFIVVVVEMAQITPPIGFNLFVLQGMTNHEMSFISRASIPMFLIMVLMVFVLILFPDLATWLPENMRPGPS